MAGDFLGELLDNIDATGDSFVETSFRALSSEMIPLVRVLFILFVMFYGLQLIAGTAKISVSEIVFRILKGMVIVILISNWNTFTLILYSWLNSVPESAGRLLLSATSSGVSEPTNGLSQIWETANKASSKFSEQSGYFSVLPALIGFFIMLVSGFFIAISLAILILAKVMLWILIGTAPIFLVLYMFEKTSGYATGWLNQVLVYSLIPLFVYGVSAFLITAAQESVANIDVSMEANDLKLSDFAPFIILSLAGGFVMLQIQTLASGIAGTISSSIGTFGAGLTYWAARSGVRLGRRTIGAGSRGMLAAGQGARANLSRMATDVSRPQSGGGGASQMQSAIQKTQVR